MARTSQFISAHRLLVVRLAAVAAVGASLLFSGCGGGVGAQPPAPPPASPAAHTQ